MTQQEKIAGNVEISRMMGLDAHGFHASPFDVDNFIYPHDFLSYHRDWNWLMAAAIRIKAIRSRNWDESNTQSLHRNLVHAVGMQIATCDINAAWAAISRFARWYNSLQQQNQ